MSTPTKAECPECWATVHYDFDCHTYQQGERWVACLPCDSAIGYYCSREDCEWHYTHGLNPGNPRSANNEQRRPAWLDGWELHSANMVNAYPGTTAAWESAR